MYPFNNLFIWILLQVSQYHSVVTGNHVSYYLYFFLWYFRILLIGGNTSIFFLTKLARIKVQQKSVRRKCPYKKAKCPHFSKWSQKIVTLIFHKFHVPAPNNWSFMGSNLGDVTVKIPNLLLNFAKTVPTEVQFC